ncbi:MAG: DUF4190 domain-containing protein [Myxococcales bacterium]|nr:DUF4190 domain-containing protein [Myxococcales bacterium]
MNHVNQTPANHPHNAPPPPAYPHQAANVASPIGYAAPPMAQGAAPAKTDGKAIVGMILGIVSIVLCWVPVLPIIGGIVGIVLFAKHRSTRRRTPGIGGNGMSIAGLVTGIIGLLAGVLYTTAWIIALSALNAASKYAL